MKSAFPAFRRLWLPFALSLVLHIVFLLGANVSRQAAFILDSSIPLKVSLKGLDSAAGEQKSPNTTTFSPSKPRLRTTEHLAHADNRRRAIPVKMAPPTTGKPAVAQNQLSQEADNTKPQPTSSNLDAPELKVSIDAARNYVLLLVPEARRLKRYPILARERGWEGTTEITVQFTRMQALPAVVISRSSGYPVLDNQALATVGEATRLVSVPESLRGKDAAIPVLITFNLEE